MLTLSNSIMFYVVFVGLKPIDEVTHLQGQVLLLHSHLLFERHKRELHAKRNRRLLGKIVKTTALEEQNAALVNYIESHFIWGEVFIGTFNFDKVLTVKKVQLTGP